MAVLENLPRSIIIYILSRLPVKSLLQIKCACKSSYALISSPDFIKTHRLSCDNDRIILCDCYGMQVCSFRQYDASLWKDFVYSFGHSRKFRVNGSCGCLVCHSSTEKNRQNVVTLLNPFTKESRKIIHRTDRGGFTSYGFGYDCLAEDYKVVAIVCKRGDLGEKEVSVYELKKKNEKSSWRRIEDFPSGRISTDSAKYVNGSLNWVVRTIKGNNRDLLDAWAIISLDLSKELYSRVQLPEAVCGGESGAFEPSLGVLQDCLALICKYPNCLRVDVWVMKKFGVADSWTKSISIPYLDSKNSFKSLVFLKNGDVVGITQLGIVTLYDTQQNKFKMLYEPQQNKIWYPTAGFDLCLPLEESLVSPNA